MKTIQSINRGHILQIFLVFLVSRILIFVIGGLSFSIFPERGQVVQRKNITEVLDLRNVWDRLDTGWYEKLADEGYPKRPFTDQTQETWGFMPLFPLLMNLTSRLFGFSLFMSGIFISNVSTLFGLYFLYKLVQDKYGQGIQAVTLVMISAGSFFLSIVYSEGLFFLLTTLVFYLSFKKHLGWAFFIAGLASITRIQGCLLFVIPGIELLINYKKASYRYIPSLLLSLLPALIFMIYLERTCGEPLAFIKIQHAWGSSELFPLQGFLSVFSGTRPGGTLTHACFWIMMIFAVFSTYRKLPVSYLVFTILYFFLSTSNESLYGSQRYMLGVLPVFIAVSITSDYLRQIFILVNILFLSLMISTFVTNSLIFL